MLAAEHTTATRQAALATVLRDRSGTGLSARLEYGLNGSGIVHAGFTVRFTDTLGNVLCTTTTNTSGIATCDSPSGLLTSVTTLLLGYNATFTSSQSNLGSSSDRGTISLL